MPKQFTPDPNGKPQALQIEDFDQISDGFADVKEELRHLVGQTCDVSQELTQLNANIAGLKEALLAVASAVLIDPDIGITSAALSHRREVIKQQLGL